MEVTHTSRTLTKRKVRVDLRIQTILTPSMAIISMHLYFLQRHPISGHSFILTNLVADIHEERNRAKTIPLLAEELGIRHLPQLVRAFLHTKIHSDDDQPCNTCPFYAGKISVFNSASSTFHAPSDLSGTGGMRREYIRACPNWQNEGPCRDCIFVVTNPDLLGFRGMDVARVLCFFSFSFQGVLYPCAVIRWFDHVGDTPDNNTGMWIVKPAIMEARQPKTTVIHLDSIFRAAHLIPVYASSPRIPPEGIHPHNSYDHFWLFYINKYADHHAFGTAF